MRSRVVPNIAPDAPQAPQFAWIVEPSHQLDAEIASTPKLLHLCFFFCLLQTLLLTSKGTDG